MKKLTYVFLLAFIGLTIASCSNKGMKVITNEEAETDLSDYSTYAWISDVENIPNAYALIGPYETLVFNNRSSQKMIKESVELQMKAKGFALDNSDPDMLINFTVLEEDTELGPRSNSIEMVPVEAGTVIINLIDSKSGTQIWQGYASGALNPDDIKNMSSVETKVGAIFEEFDFSQFETE